MAFAPGSPPPAGDPRGVRLPPGPSAAAQAVAHGGLTLRSDNPIDPWGEPTASFRGQKRVLGLEACGSLAGSRLVLCAGKPRDRKDNWWVGTEAESEPSAVGEDDLSPELCEFRRIAVLSRNRNPELLFTRPPAVNSAVLPIQ